MVAFSKWEPAAQQSCPEQSAAWRGVTSLGEREGSTATCSNYRHHFISFEGGNEVPGAHLIYSWLYRTLFFLLVLSSALSVVTVTFKDRHCQLFISILGWPGIITSWQGCLTLWVPVEGYVFAKWQLFRLNFPAWVPLQGGKYQSRQVSHFWT